MIPFMRADRSLRNESHYIRCARRIRVKLQRVASADADAESVFRTVFLQMIAPLGRCLESAFLERKKIYRFLWSLKNIDIVLFKYVTFLFPHSFRDASYWYTLYFACSGL